MIKDGSFILNDKNCSNIIDISKKQSFLFERRVCEISELVDDAAGFFIDMSNEGYGIYEILSMISEGFNVSADVPHREHLYENIQRLSSYLKLLSSLEKAVFSELLTERLKSRSLMISESDFLQSAMLNENITYVKNPLADEAYDVFSQEFKNPRLKYSKSFSEVVLAIRSGEVQYALLPIEEKGGVRLGSIAELIFREDLKINSITSVFGYEGNADMKYALISKYFWVPKSMPDDDRYLEIRISKDSLSMPIFDLFVAADHMGLDVYRINTITFTTEDGQSPYYSVVLKKEGGDFTPLLVFLTLFSGAYTPVGIYKNLE